MDKELKNLIDIRCSGKIVDLVDFVMEMSERADTRLWIISPFCGSKRILDTIFNIESMLKRGVDFRLLTNIDNISMHNYALMNFFKEKGKLRTLKNLHAKLYIINDSCIITSANLTKQAFFKNHELALTSYNKELYEEVFNELWLKGINVTDEMFDNALKNSPEEDYDENNEDSDYIREFPKEFTNESNYQIFLIAFRKLEKVYSPFIMWKSPLKFEIDSFLNYLFNHEQGYPARKYYNNNDFNEIPEVDQIEFIQKYINEYQTWFKSDKNNWDTENRRIDFSKKVKSYLSEEHIEKLQMDEFIDILETSINSYERGNKRFNWSDKFKKNNKIEEVRIFIKELLNCNIKNVDKIVKNPKLKPFGKSSAQELLGLYRDDYPIRNENVNAGLRFLGFKV